MLKLGFAFEVLIVSGTEGGNWMKKLNANRVRPSKVIVRFEFDPIPTGRFVRKPSDRKVGEFIPA